MYITASDPHVFKIKDCPVILSIYVNDAIIISNNEAKSTKILTVLKGELEDTVDEQKYLAECRLYEVKVE